MNHNTVKPLTVFRASAGSGKTFTLAIEYIKLLILNPAAYREILAVTFTNKATEEMKMRILSQLYGIWKQLPDSESYMEKVTQQLGISRATASQRAGQALSYLIHNYSYFRVQTIDTFFQSVMRNLARELDLTANLRIGLNDQQVEEQAVDELIESLTTTDAMLQWIMNYITANINDDKSWNVINKIKQFGNRIFDDAYKDETKAMARVMSQKDFFGKYMARLRKTSEDSQSIMNGLADEFFQTLEACGLTTDMLSGKSKGISSYFNKLRGNDWSDKKCVNQTLTKHLDSAEQWVAKTNKERSAIIPIVEQRLLPILSRAESQRPVAWKLYKSAEITLRHLYQLRLLGSIEGKVRQLNRDANRFLLSDTQHLLHAMIDDSDSPFIFERIGSQLKHIMIDEFQDTSTVQWQNFKVLLKDTMSHAENQNNGAINNLIVGDVKQSIYRWRSGDWRLLNDIDSQFGHGGQMIDHKPLKTNYRSSRNVIEFNNAFFAAAIAKELENEQEVNPQTAHLLADAYHDVEQIVPEGREQEGLVSITLLPKERFQEAMIEQLAATVAELRSAGIPANKIAILVRTKKKIPAVADYFMRNLPEERIVSDEAFCLDASAAVCILVEAMRLLCHPDDVLIKTKLAISWQNQVMGASCSYDDMTNRLDSLLPADFLCRMDTLLREPLYELAEQLFAIFQLAKLSDEGAYVCTFFDCISDFVRENSTDVSAFLSQWDDELHKKTIQSADIDGIRMISIHKSKGLEFDNVIIPYCNWQMENHRDSMLWCKPTEEPFSQLPLVPIDCSSALLQTIYADDYREEHLQNTVDNMNLLYVAFTRASSNLFVIGKRDDKETRSWLIQNVLPQVEQSMKGARLEGLEEADKPLTFSYGTLIADNKKKTEKASSNVFLQPSKPMTVPIDNYVSPLAFRQSNKSRDFVRSIDDEEPEDQQSIYIKMGNILHNLFSQIRTTADIDGVLRQLEFEGVLYDEQISAPRLRTMLHSRLSNEQVADWFSDRWTLFNECTILALDPQSGQLVERRPDRVMTDGKRMIVVDFKFGKPQQTHHDQVREYAELLTSMGYANVEGYLWYVYSNKIVKA